MIKAELANEGCANTEAAAEAFNKYNKHLKRDPEALARTIAHTALGEEIAEQSIAMGVVVGEVLNTTNNGTQIGIGENREAAWAVIFEDPSHQEAHRKYSERLREENNIKYTIEEAQTTIDRLLKAGDKATAMEVRQEVTRLQDTARQVAEEVTALRRVRGMHALRAIAIMNTDIEIPSLIETSGGSGLMPGDPSPTSGEQVAA